MSNILGNETWARCAGKLSSSGAKEYELSYERSLTMPKSPFAGDYEPKFLPPVGVAGTKQIYNMDVLNENVNDGNQGTQMDALGHFSYNESAWDGSSELDVSKAKYFGGMTQAEVKPTKDSPLLKLGIETVPPIITSAITAEIITKVLEKCNVNVEILGFTTKEWKGGNSKKKCRMKKLISNLSVLTQSPNYMLIGW